MNTLALIDSSVLVSSAIAFVLLVIEYVHDRRRRERRQSK